MDPAFEDIWLSAIRSIGCQAKDSTNQNVSETHRKPFMANMSRVRLILR